VSFFDTSIQRESACPVHFVWDGNGLGRPVVRVAFLLCLVAGATLALGQMLHIDAVNVVGRVTGVVAGIMWLSGQGLTRLAQRQPRIPTKAAP
jgi:hypothetical protein